MKKHLGLLGFLLLFICIIGIKDVRADYCIYSFCDWPGGPEYTPQGKWDHYNDCNLTQPAGSGLTITYNTISIYYSTAVVKQNDVPISFWTGFWDTDVWENCFFDRFSGWAYDDFATGMGYDVYQRGSGQHIYVYTSGGSYVGDFHFKR